MSQQSDAPRSGGYAPVVLRLTVAAALAYCGLRTLATANQTADAAPATEPALILQAAAVNPTDTQPAPDGPPDTITAFSLRPHHILAGAELGFALTMAMGLLVRLSALIGLGFSVVAALGASGAVASTYGVDFLAGVFSSSPAAVLLLGAVCLTLVLAGAGGFSIDRILFNRRQQRGTTAEA